MFSWTCCGLAQDTILKRLLNKPMDLSLVLWTGNEVGQNDDGLPEGLKRPKNLPEGISKASASGDSLAWANAYPTRYTVLEGNPTVIAQYEEIAKEHTVYQAQIDADGVLRDLDTGEKKRLYLIPIAITL